VSRGCIPPIVLLVSALAGWAVFLSIQLPEGFLLSTLICTFLGGLASTVFGVIVYQAFSLRGAWRASGRAQRGLPLEPGKPGGALGELHPTGDFLLAPFSGTPAIAYEYQISREGGEHRNASDESGTGTVQPREKSVAYAGRAIAPCEVRTKAGPVRIGTGPVINVYSEVALGPEARDRARHFVAVTVFADAGGDGVPEGYGGNEGAPSEAAGFSRVDWKVRGAPPDLERWHLSESVVRPGEKVFAFGLYSPSADGLVRDADGKTGRLSIEPSDSARAPGYQRPTGLSALLPFALLFFQVLLALVAVTPEGHEMLRDLARTPTARRR
jgi:hypothetical protein